jgi:hypothetical protein
MLSWQHWCAIKMIKFQHLFHGTSSVHKISIQESGLLPINGAIYLTTHPLVALIEALRTVNGEQHLADGYKKGVGGSPLVVLIKRSAVSNLRVDVCGYYERTKRTDYRRSEIRFAFTVSECIPSASMSFLETDLYSECDKRLKEIERMTSSCTFWPALKCDVKKRRVCLN